MNMVEADNEKIINKYISNMPSLSTTISMVLKVCNSPETTAIDLNRVITLDPVLTGNVLKLINSAYYSLRDRVTSLTKAIIMLGMNTIKNLAISTAILGTLNKTKSVKVSSNNSRISSLSSIINTRSLNILRPLKHILLVSQL